MTIPDVPGSSTGTWKSIINALIALINAAFDTVTAGLAKRPYVWADSTARLAQTGMTVGEYGYQTDTQVTYRAISATTTEPWSSPWITWTTAPTNITVGTGGSALSVQQYKYVAGRLLFRCHYIFGSSGASMGSGPVINLPMSLLQPTPRFAELVSAGGAYDLNVTTAFPCRPRLNAAAANQVIIASYAGTYTTITATAPMTWAAGDELAVEFWGDPA